MIDRIEKREKFFIRMEKEYWAIREKIRKLPWVKLKEPEQHGWILNIDLIPEALRRSDGERMAQCLAMCAKDHICRKGESERITKIRKDKSLPTIRSIFTKYDEEGRAYYTGPELKVLTKKEYEGLAETHRKFFDEVVTEHNQRWGSLKTYTYKYVINIPEHYMQVHVKKRMLTLYQDIDPELESREDYLGYVLDPYWREMGGGGWDDPRKSTKTERRHWKDALTHTVKGDIIDPKDYKKLQI